ELKEQRVLVTGAGRGIGRAIASRFAEAGCAVALLARTCSEIDAAVDELQSQKRRAIGLTCDVTDSMDVKRAVAMVEKELGGVDILVNNAGYAHFVSIADLDVDEWQRTLDVNLTGPFYCIKAVLPGMMERRFGRIINISSVAGVKPLLNQSAYCASKHGLNGLSKVLALELKEHGIAVHAVCPGGVDTQLARDAMPDRDKSGWMTSDDIAHTCLYLARLSPRATVDEIIIRRFGSVPLGG
ncbi:MAG: SDR family oxidoreductase, partial [Anaerolineae bacterium]|nr:SDR family oxidoreductase [Anaerolineae bacterium]